MKRLGLLLAATLWPFGAAGELAALHSRLAAPAPVTDECDAPPPPPGTAYAPGARPCAPPPPAAPTVSEIGIERGRCLAGCPAYTFIVQADGSFRYVGEYNVERLGVHSGRVSVGRLLQVLRFAEAIDVAAMDDSYTSGFLDNPTVYTLVTQGGRQKVVADEGRSGPATLWALEELIDSLLETAVWDTPVGE